MRRIDAAQARVVRILLECGMIAAEESEWIRQMLRDAGQAEERERRPPAAAGSYRQ